MAKITEQEQATRALLRATYKVLAEWHDEEYPRDWERLMAQLELAADALARLK